MARHFAVIGLAFVALVIALMLVSGKPAEAQAGSVTFRARLERLNSGSASFVVRFTAPVAGAFDVTLPDNSRRIDEIGDDYFCFSELWNDTRRAYCTPYANVTSVSFVQ
jgi:preprotein translocase subunit SecG